MRVLFIVGNMDAETSAAANIWLKNLATAFSIGGHNSTILYIGSRSTKSYVKQGVKYLFLSRVDAFLMRIPRIRSLVFPKLFKKYILKYNGIVDLVMPVEGPYTIKRELFKVDLVKKVGAKYLFKILEHPKFNAQSNSLFEYEKYMTKTANLYDIIMPITRFIKDEYSKFGRTKPIFLNPIITNVEGIEKVIPSISHCKKKLIYCGNLGHSEEMEILFNEFSIALKEYSKLSLTVIGGGVSKRHTKFLLGECRTFCENLGIENSVKFTGRILHKEVLKYYNKGDIFLLPRPSREYSKAGFPSKLGEYLMTGKPVVAYPTGDIPLYLKDNVSAYFVKNEDLGTFGHRIVDVIKDLKFSTVGEQGAKVATNSFSLEATAERINCFFNKEFKCN